MRALLLVPIFSLLPACVGSGRYHHASHCGPNAGDAIVATLEIVGAIAQIAAAADSREEQVVVEQVAPPPPPPAEPWGPPPVMPPREAKTGPEPRLFASPAQARDALSAQDVSVCKDHGAPRGYGHATVVFGPNGVISNVMIDAPANLPSDAAACLGERLSHATIAPFPGAALNVGTTFFVP